MSRAERLAIQMRRELSEMVLHEIKQADVQAATLLTVTHVRLSDDLGVAWVQVSVVGEAPPRDVIKGLAKAAGWMRGELGKRLRTRKVPTLRFVLDETNAQADKVERLLDEIAADDKERQ